MNIYHQHQRLAVLIDCANLYHSAKRIYKRRVHFAGVLDTVMAGRQLVRAIGYTATTEGGEEKAFLEQLPILGIEPVTKDLQIFQNGTKKADWDVGIAVDAIALAEKVDVIVIATGDGDFMPLVEYLANRGVRVEIAGFGQSSALKLKENADTFWDLSKSLDKHLLQIPRQTRDKYKRQNKEY